MHGNILPIRNTLVNAEIIIRDGEYRVSCIEYSVIFVLSDFR